MTTLPLSRVQKRLLVALGLALSLFTMRALSEAPRGVEAGAVVAGPPAPPLPPGPPPPPPPPPPPAPPAPPAFRS